jgi:hypothetical protein
VATWPHKEVARRYLSINLQVRNLQGESPRQSTDVEIACELAKPSACICFRALDIPLKS